MAKLAGHERSVTSQVTVDLSFNVNAAVERVLAAIGPDPTHHQIIKLAKIADGETLDGETLEGEADEAEGVDAD